MNSFVTIHMFSIRRFVYTNTMHNTLKILFFGTPEFARDVLETLDKGGIQPTLVVTQEDKPVGRKMLITPPEVKTWALSKDIPVLQPKTLKSTEVENEIKKYGPFDVALVASYGKIIPQSILDIPKRGTLNIHPSLLPRHRGASPIQSTILEGDPFGVSIILLDEEMDHGPLLGQKQIPESTLPKDSNRIQAEKVLAQEGAELFASLLPSWINSTLTAKDQDHTRATFCKKIQKADGEVDLATDNPITILRKVRAFAGWPSTFFFTTHKDARIRVQIIDATIEDGKITLLRVKPEGKGEMSYTDFLRGNQCI